MEHVLRFPEKCVGYLRHDAPAGHELKPIGPAQGVVRLAVDARVHFVVIDPAWLSCLHPLAPEGLVSVALNKTPVTDGQLAALAPFQGLTYISMSKARAIGDEGLAHLRGLRRLEVLDLYSTRVSDAGLVHLRGLASLEQLHLGATRVRGSGLQWLSGLKALRRLNLERTRVDDGALAPLRALLLRELVLSETLVSGQGAAEFLEHRPACQVWGQLGAQRAGAGSVAAAPATAERPDPPHRPEAPDRAHAAGRGAADRPEAPASRGSAARCGGPGWAGGGEPSGGNRLGGRPGTGAVDPQPPAPRALARSGRNHAAGGQPLRGPVAGRARS